MIASFSSILFTWILPILIVLTGLYLAARTEILRDAITTEKKNFSKIPFSFARTQLWWWSMVIMPLFSMYYGENGSSIVLASSDYTYLVLMGISVGTVASARVIDNTDIADQKERHQDINDSKGFLFDIISDASGVSIHRFQAMVFNLIFGLMFILHFFANCQFLNLGAFELALMGISSATYVGIKISENPLSKKNSGKAAGESVNKKELQAAASGEEDDLSDIDESYNAEDEDAIN